MQLKLHLFNCLNFQIPNLAGWLRLPHETLTHVFWVLLGLYVSIIDSNFQFKCNLSLTLNKELYNDNGSIMICTVNISNANKAARSYEEFDKQRNNHMSLNMQRNTENFRGTRNALTEGTALLTIFFLLYSEKISDIFCYHI